MLYVTATKSYESSAETSIHAQEPESQLVCAVPLVKKAPSAFFFLNLYDWGFTPEPPK